MNAALSTADRPRPPANDEESIPVRKRSALEQTIADEISARERLRAERNNAEDVYAISYLQKLREAVEQIAASYALIRAQKATIRRSVNVRAHNPYTRELYVNIAAKPRGIKTSMNSSLQTAYDGVILQINKSKEGMEITARLINSYDILPQAGGIFDRKKRKIRVENILEKVPELMYQEQYLEAICASARALSRAIREQEFSYKADISCNTPEEAESIYRERLLKTAEKIAAIVTKD